MTLEMPKSPKIYTTAYDNFKGVDYTNDSTNVWKKRSPSGVNMLPDASGRPFKREGWGIFVSAQSFIDVYNDTTGNSYEGELETFRSLYFELGGITHIMCFTGLGLFLVKYYPKEEVNAEVKLLSTNEAVKNSFDRAFFFEGDGKSAFYIYGDYKVWAYSTDGFNEVEPYIPVITISTTPDGVGEMYEAVNLLSGFYTQHFQNNIYSCSVTQSDVNAKVDSEKFAKMTVGAVYEYIFTFDGTDWKLSNTAVDIGEYGITFTDTPSSGNTITVKVSYRTYLASNISQSQISSTNIKVNVSAGTKQFGTSLEVKDQTSTITTGQCKLCNEVVDGKTIAYIEYADAWLPIVDGEDAISITYVRQEVTYTPHDTDELSVEARIGG